MEKIRKLEALVEESRDEAAKLYEKDNKASAARLRKNMQEIKAVAQEIRADALKHKQKIPTKSGRKPPVKK